MPFDCLALGQLVTLRDGGSELVVAPECGARLVAFRVDGRDVLRPASAATLKSATPYGSAAFPLMPYSGLIFGKLQVYDAWDDPDICVEPVTNVNDGFNRAARDVAGQSVIVREPGRSLAGTVTIATYRQ